MPMLRKLESLTGEPINPYNSRKEEGSGNDPCLAGVLAVLRGEIKAIGKTPIDGSRGLGVIVLTPLGPERMQFNRGAVGRKAGKVYSRGCSFHLTACGLADDLSRTPVYDPTAKNPLAGASFSDYLGKLFSVKGGEGQTIGYRVYSADRFMEEMEKQGGPPNFNPLSIGGELRSGVISV